MSIVRLKLKKKFNMKCSIKGCKEQSEYDVPQELCVEHWVRWFNEGYENHLGKDKAERLIKHDIKKIKNSKKK